MQPPASHKALGDPLYEAFYGFSEQPFAISTDPRFFYLSGTHRRAYSELLNGLKRRESLLLVTGDTGSGKTTLCRTVLDALGDRTFSALVLNPYMSGAEVLRIVLRDFGVVSRGDLRRGALAAADVPQLLDTIEGFLTSVQTLSGYAVVVIDEAQSLQPTVLDQIRMLTALEHQQQRLVQVVLCGQPGLASTVQDEALQALNDRITRRIELLPLTPDDVAGYIQHRMGVAGAGATVRFDADAMQAVAELSGGLPRRVNVLCDRALQEGRLEGVSVITGDLVERAARAIGGVPDPTPAPPAVPTAPLDDVTPPDPAVGQTDTTPQTEAAASSTAAEAASTRSADRPALSFGHKAEPARPRLAGTLLTVVAGGGVIAASIYAGWAWSAGTAATVVPRAPTARVLNVGAPAVAHPVLEGAARDAMMAELLLWQPAGSLPPVAPGPASPGAPAPASGQNPNNGN